MSTPAHALVLTAGLGTRLRPLTDVRAKPAIPVGGEPMIRRVVRWLVLNRVSDIVLNLHHLPHTVAAVMGDGSDLSARVRYSWEQPLVLGTAGGPRQALSIIGTDTFFLVNGDTLTDLDLPSLGEACEGTPALVTLALVPNREPHRYGGVQLDAERQVTGFVPRGRSAVGSYHFIGVQLVHVDAFRALPAGQPAQSIGGVYETLIATRPGAIRGVVTDAAFWDIGTVSDYWSTSWSFIGAEDRPGVTHGQRSRIDPAAHVSRSILWDDVAVSCDCVLDECVITDGVSVPPGTHLRRSILLRQTDGTTRVSPF